MKRIYLILYLIVFVSLASFTGPENSTLIVKVGPIKNNKGNVCIMLFNNPEGYPKKKDLAYKVDFSPSREIVSFTFKDLPKGRYAVVILHDENMNFKMDYNIIGIPKEGFGFFNVKSMPFKVPSFEETSVDFKGGEYEEYVKVIY
jgi:uncharacterized protein (DUF2141 family)